MTTKLSQDKAIEARIHRAFEGPNRQWRTLHAVAREANLPEAEVEAYLDRHEELFRRASLTPAGMPMYGLKALNK